MPYKTVKRVRLDDDDRAFEAAYAAEPAPEIFVCPVTGKKGWRKKSKADGVAAGVRKQSRDPFVEAFLCEHCGRWHVGRPAGSRRAREDLVAAWNQRGS